MTNRILQGLRNKDDAVIREVYVREYPWVRNMVETGGGTTAEAEDVFQDALMVMYHRAREADFILRGTFSAYLRGVCRKSWATKLRRKRLGESVAAALAARNEPPPGVEDDIVTREKQRLIRQHFAALDEKCQELLRLSFQGVPGEEIALRMGYTYDYVRNKARRCRRSLIEKVQADPRYRELSDDAELPPNDKTPPA